MIKKTMKNNNTRKNEIRSKIVFAVISLAFAALFIKSAYVSVVQGATYSDIADNKIYRRINISAPRGEIRDRYGTLLAGNREAFSIEIYPSGATDVSDLNSTITEVIRILEDNEEKIKDEFPITIEGNTYKFTYDTNVENWKKSNEIPLDFTAQQTFDRLVEILSGDGTISITEEDDNASIQSKIIEAGYYPPISVSKGEFTEIVKKQEFLMRYIGRYLDKSEEKVYSVTAKEAFSYLRDTYEIDKSLSDEAARKIMNVRFLINQKGYYQYEPTTIAEDIKKETVTMVEENSINLKGINVVSSSIRHYPNGNLSSHILGQLGRISSQAEIDKYVTEKNYNRNSIIGKTGIEKNFEEELNGEDGYTQVQVDVGGRLVKTLERKDPKKGDTVYLTIDAKLQAVAEKSLAKALNTIQSGGTYDSPWGNMRMRDNQKVYNKAKSGAVVVMDVKNGDILAMASYPDYDPNLFVQGISTEDFASLTPANINDSIAPKPLYNTATMTAIEPGSTFKMVTGLTGLDLGLSPYYEIYDGGKIDMGGRTFGCWIWNQRRGSHGNENLMEALRDSCNYYFYSVATGFNYYTKQNLPIKIKAQDILATAEKFGLNEKTGIQIEEVKGSIPNLEGKEKRTKNQLESVLNRMMKNYFEGIDSDSPKYKENITTIVNWMGENPPREEIANRLRAMGVKEEYVYKVTDDVKYTYFNQASWQTGDSFNMSIGQGDHQYTPVQMARFVSAIANDGYLNDVTVVDKIEASDKTKLENIEKKSEKIDLINSSNLKYIKEGMEAVTAAGSSAGYFRNLPIKLAGKSGTAQKTGKIPAADEEAYLLSHLGGYGVNRNDVIRLTDKLSQEDDNRLSRYVYMQRAILDLNPKMTIARLNNYKESYDPFAWLVTYAPAQSPEIAVVTLLFQGGHGDYGAAITRDIYAEYFNLIEETNTENNFSFDDYVR